MSGAFEPTATIGRPARPSPPRRRALEVPDFDAASGPAPPDAAALAAAATEAAARKAALEEAERRGFAAGHDAAERKASEGRIAAETASLATISTAIAAAERTIGTASDAAAFTLSRLLLAALDAALPAASARLAPESAALLAGAVAPILDHEHGYRLFVATGFGAAVADRIDDPRVEIVEDATLPPGDARASWRGGGGIQSLAQRRAAVATILTTLGLGPEEGADS